MAFKNRALVEDLSPKACQHEGERPYDWTRMSRSSTSHIEDVERQSKDGKTRRE